MQFIQSGKYDWTLESIIDKWNGMHLSENIGLKVVELKESNSIIGEAGLLQIPRKEKSFIEIGYMIDQAFRGKGFGFEIAKALVVYARDKMELKELNAGVNEYNLGSIKILEKCGFSRIDTQAREKGGNYLLYHISL